MSEKKSPICALCKIRKCNSPEIESVYPGYCTKINYAALRVEAINANWTNPDYAKINQVSDYLLKKSHDRERLTRVEELIEYATMLGYQKLGLAFCVGLWEEARTLTNILMKKGFKVISVACSAGATEGEPEREHRIICNPLMQAEVLNQEHTDLNIMVGLCIGHDILFIKNSKADVTPLVVKDRVTGHNPVAVLHTAHSYYRQKFE